MCMTRLNQLDLTEPVTIEPMRDVSAHLRDLVTDVSWNYRAKKSIRKFTPRPPRRADGTWRMTAGRRRARAGVPQVHRVLPLPGRLPRAARPSDVRRVRRSAPPGLRGRARNAPARSSRTARADLKARTRDRLLQHHEVLHESLPGRHHHHRQRHHPAQGTRRRSALRSRRQGAAPVSPCRLIACRHMEVRHGI